MARKQLVISIKAVDQISAPIRRTMASIGRLGRKAISTTNRVLRGMGGLAKSLLNVRTLFAGLAAAFAAVALVRSILRVSEALDRTAKTARALGVEVEEYSKLEFAAERSGIAVNKLARAFLTAQRYTAQYIRGEGGAAARAFKDLDVNLTDANGRVKQGTELLTAILDPINKIQDEAVKTQKLYDIFGRTGAEFKNIGGELANLLRDAERYGAITRNQTVVAEAFQDSLTNLGRAWAFLRASVLEAIGPSLTKAINTAAEKMADFGRLVGGIYQAFADTANDPDTRLALGNAISLMLGRASEIMIIGIQAMARTAGVVIQNSIEPLMILIRNSLGPSLGNVIIETIGEAIAKVWDWMGKAPAGMETALSRFFQDLAQQTRDGMAYLKEEMGSGGELLEAFDESLRRSLHESGSNAVRAVDDILNDAFRKFHMIASRDLGGVTEIIDDLVTRLKDVKEAMPDLTTSGTNYFDDFALGVRNAAASVGTLQDQMRTLGNDVFNTVGNQISTGLSDMVTGAASVKDAFRDMAKGILDDLAQLTIRLLVFRALSSAFGSFGVGGSTTTSTSQTVGSGFSSAFARTGGVMQPGGHIRHFAMGGVVPGPNINRDMVPSMLAPGEGVVNRRGMRSMGAERLHALNRGESVGGDIHITQNNSFAGGVSSSTVRQSADALMAALLDAMRRHPGFRDQVRGMLT